MKEYEVIVSAIRKGVANEVYSPLELYAIQHAVDKLKVTLTDIEIKEKKDGILREQKEKEKERK